jgi:hypothetical protein
MRRFYFFPLLFCLFLSSCGTSSLPSLPPEEIIQKAVVRMQSLTAFHFIFTHSGPPAIIDEDYQLAFARAEGDFVAPDRGQGTVRVTASGLTAEVQIVSIGDRFWETNPLTGEWEEYAPGTMFNPAVLFDPQTGILSMLKDDLSDLKLVGTQKLEEWPGKKLYTIEANMKSDHIYALTEGLIGPKLLNIKVWVAPETFEVYRVQLTDLEEGSDKPSVWKADFLKFNQSVEIQPPMP